MNEPHARPRVSGVAPTNNDPLAELARLIGQHESLPNTAQRNARALPPRDPRRPMPEPEWRGVDPFQTSADPRNGSGHAGYYDSYPPAAPSYDAGTAGAYDQRYAEAHGYDPASGSYPPSYREAQSGQPYYPHADEAADMYEDAAPARRRGGLLTVMAVLLLAVVGTAAAFGYRAIFKPSGSAVAPPVIKADTAPSKVVPAATAKDPNSSKLIYDRVGDRSQTERVVVREEQPLDTKEVAVIAPRVVLPGPQQGTTNPQATLPASANALAAASSSGSEPKKVRTVTIRPDQADAAESPAPRTAARTTQTQVATAASADVSPPGPAPVRQSVSRPRMATSQDTAAPAANAPLSLSPQPANSASRTVPARTASVPARTAEPAEGAYSVQVSSQRSETEAQAAFRSLQAKFPNILGDRQAVIRRADLGEKGVYYRAQVGPFASSEQASELCSSLKAAGGQCVVQRN